jgi:Animal haem peroxidase
MAKKSESKIRPFQPAPPDRYCRLFEPVSPPFDLEVMQRLGRSMSRLEGPIAQTGDQGTTIPAGYTYFGQFIDHDITRDDTYLFAASPEIRKVANKGGGRLDLDHMYGDGPASYSHGHLYDGPFFRLGDTTLPNGSRFDLWLKDGRPQSVDDRTTENIILRQLCVMFMMLHNAAVRELPTSLSTFERFEQARTRVQWQYQWLVYRDYLQRVCTKKVFEALIYSGESLIDWQTDSFAVPVEFSEAAFRFGHSMVRPSYFLRDNTAEVPLERIFSGPNPKGALSTNRAIDWLKFLDPGRQAVENSMLIDTAVAPPLFCLPREHVHHWVTQQDQHLPPELPVRTLFRGALTHLPTGEMIEKRLGREVPLREEPVITGEEDPWETLDGLGLREKTPLWYYVLLEADIQENGLRLGTVGSRLVAETLDGALRADPMSYLTNTNEGWTPPEWKTPAGRSMSIRRMWHLPIVVGLAEELANQGPL